MPKLGQDELEKRFACPHCGDTFRTRQGLSGHIQWKHPAGKASTGITDKWLLETIELMESVWAPVFDWSPSDLRVRARILRRWPEFEKMCDLVGIKSSREVFKNYFITSLAFLQVIESMQ